MITFNSIGKDVTLYYHGRRAYDLISLQTPTLKEAEELKSTSSKLIAGVKSFFGKGSLLIGPNFTLYVTRESVTKLQSTVDAVAINTHGWFAVTIQPVQAR